MCQSRNKAAVFSGSPFLGLASADVEIIFLKHRGFLFCPTVFLVKVDVNYDDTMFPLTIVTTCKLLLMHGQSERDVIHPNRQVAAPREMLR